MTPTSLKRTRAVQFADWRTAGALAHCCDAPPPQIAIRECALCSSAASAGSGHLALPPHLPNSPGREPPEKKYGEIQNSNLARELTVYLKQLCCFNFACVTQMHGVMPKRAVMVNVMVGGASRPHEPSILHGFSQKKSAASPCKCHSKKDN